MTAIERTAYRRLHARPTPHELAELFTPTPEEITFAQASTRGKEQQFAFLALMKCYQYLRYFPDLERVPLQILQYLRTCLALPPTTPCATPKRSRLRYYALIRPFCGITYDPERARDMVTDAIQQAARTMDHPADLINAALETVDKAKLEMPAFSTIDRIAGHIRTQVNMAYFTHVAERLTENDQAAITRLLTVEETTGHSPLFRVKSLASSATVSHIDEWLKRLTWLQSYIDTWQLLGDIPATKLRHFAAEARSLDVAELADVQQPKRTVLVLALLHHAQITTTDELITMLIKRMATIQKRGKDALQRFHEHHRDTQEQLLDVLATIVQASRDTKDNTALGDTVRTILGKHGGPEQILHAYETMAAYHGHHHLPFLWEFFKSHRAILFRLLKVLPIHSTSQDQSVVQAWQFLLDHEYCRGPYVPPTLPLDFTSEQWQRTITVHDAKGRVQYDRRHLEVCICEQIAADFKRGDLAVLHSLEFADMREQLLPWEKCQPLLADYCEEVQLPDNGHAFVQYLKQQLTHLAEDVDAHILHDGNVHITDNGDIILKRPPPSPASGAGDALMAAMQPYLPHRSILEILKNMHHWTGWTRHFGPLSGSDPKLADPLTRYVILAFGQGCNLGFAQTAKHLRNDVTAHELSFVNRRHVTSQRIDKAIVDLIHAYHQCALPKLWGTGKIAAADGTKIDIYQENLMSEPHFRYGGKGGIAYYHISDLYVALFSHFITCGTWEGVYIIDGLLKNKSSIQPDMVHADTQGQSTIVFAVAYLLGIELMPRIRNWHDLVFFRPDPHTRYRSIDTLFGDPIDWDLIETHWQDLFQIILSIKEGKLDSSTILRKLGSNSHKNRIYQVFREVGRAVRTLFLLRYISDRPLREQITACTNKVESYNEFQQWIRFGREGILEENDPIEMEKMIKFTQLVANAIMLSNVLDMSAAIRHLMATGYLVTTQAVAEIGPTIRQHIHRYGEWFVDLADAPPPLDEQAYANDILTAMLANTVA
jgi:TnpA family transposase